MGNFKNHEIKIIIREQWCKPIIKHLHDNLGCKLVYFGLPGLNGYDIKSWIEYIDYVIAIDCGVDPKKWNYEKAKSEIKKLNDILRGFERKEQITGFSLYLGFLEEVIIKKKDRNGNDFSFINSVHIFNLDFCNSLTTPYKVVVQGKTIKYYKSQVIRKLLDLQRGLSETGISKFIMFVTIHSHFLEKEAHDYFSNNTDETYIALINSLEGQLEEDVIVRLLRYYFFDIIKNHFTSCEYIPEFFPPIIYEGTGNHKLVCFTIAGTLKISPAGSAPFYQNINNIINSKFLTVSENKGIIINESDHDTIQVDIDPIKCFEDFRSYQELWIEK